MIPLVLLKVSMKASMFQAPKQPTVPMLSWQTGHTGYPHKRSFYVRHFIPPPHQKKEEWIIFQSWWFVSDRSFPWKPMSPQCSNEFLLDVVLTSQGYQLSFQRKTYTSLMRGKPEEVEGKSSGSREQNEARPRTAAQVPEEHGGKAKTRKLVFRFMQMRSENGSLPFPVSRRITPSA